MLLFYGGMMLWLGSIVFFGVGVASVVFKHLPSKDLAGHLNGIILQRLNVLEMVGAAMAFAAVLLWNTTQAKAQQQRQRWKMLVPVAVLLLMGLNLLFYAQYITPTMQTLKSHIHSFDAPAPSDAPLLAEFRSWHVVYSRLVGVNILLGLGAFVWQTWLLSRFIVSNTASKTANNLKNGEIVNSEIANSEIANSETVHDHLHSTHAAPAFSQTAIMLLFCGVTATAAPTLLQAQQAQQAQQMQQFFGYWSDGKAELNSYTSRQMRYGEPRTADVVMIYVTEPFNSEKQVKSDVPTPQTPLVNVLKLNRNKTFTTGIYDYHLMSSVFVPVQGYTIGKTGYAAGVHMKITFSSQEWCGQTFHQLNRRAQGVESRSFSYFESESDQQTLLPADANTMFADQLFIAVRELMQTLPTQASSAVQYVPMLETVRLSHRPLALSSATLKRQDVKHVWQGKSVEATQWTLATSENQAQWTFVVEKAYPRKILAYQYQEGSAIIEQATLQASVRLPYWQLNRVGNESYKQQLRRSGQ